MNLRFVFAFGLLLAINIVAVAAQNYATLVPTYQTALQNYTNLTGTDRLNALAGVEQALANLQSAVHTNNAVVTGDLSRSGMLTHTPGESFDQLVQDFFTTQQANISNLSTQATNSITANQTSLESANSDLTSKLGDAQSSISSLQGQVAQDQTNLTGVQGQLAQSQTKATALQTQLTQVQSEYNALQTQDAALQTKLSFTRLV